MGLLSDPKAPTVDVVADPLTVPHVRRVWAAVKVWPDGRVLRKNSTGCDVWHDALLTESDVTRGRRAGCAEMPMVDDDLRCVLERYGLWEFVHYEISCYVPGVHGTGWMQMSSSAAGMKAHASSCEPVVRLVCVGTLWLAMVPGSTVKLLSGLWEEHVPEVHDLGVAIVVPETEKVCNGVAYAYMSTKARNELRTG